MKNIDKKNYDLLWKWGMSFLFMSVYLESGYTDVDSISCNDGNENYLFISKKARKKLSKKTYKSFTSNFVNFKKELEGSHEEMIRYLLEESTKDISKISQEELKNGFEKMVYWLRKAWQVYFPVEPHSLDLISHEVQQGKDKKLKNNVEDITLTRQKHRDLINQIMYSPGPYAKYRTEIIKRLGRSIDNLSYQEVIKILDGNTGIGGANKIVIEGLFSNWEIIEGEKAKKIFKKLIPESNNTRELRGSVGCGGYYKGKVRKIEFSLETVFSKEIKAMKNGEVLVSGSTGPEMILACKKAGAIVTEEGGMLTHATIVSRELGIPCVVGTKIATKIFETGDMIEVDADNGVVRKL